MRKPGRRLATLAAAAVAILPFAAHAQLPAPPSAEALAVRAAWWDGYLANGRLVALPDGRRMHLYCEGSGGPVVVLDAGLGDGAWSFAGVQDAIARTSRVCSYDRAGYGTSSPGPMPRDSKALADDLFAMLKASGEAGPYVVVGHSIASLDVREFALTHPKDVAGLVLIDPSYEGQMERMAAVAPTVAAAQANATAPYKMCAATPRTEAADRLCGLIPTSGLPPAAQAWMKAQARGPAYFQAMLGELDAFQGADAADTRELTGAREALAAKAKGRPPLGDTPLVVLTATSHPAPGMTAEEGVAMERLWNAMHDQIAALSARGSNRIVPGATHYIHDVRPQLVVDAVAEVVAAARKGR
ncbi:alpha/beta hydrolase [Phenylobacterium sp.]|uniref:alpha/beta fold hydrolase n=1 Tax=Phenylobacterium sp. TaxID=1871053 RepID=UPI002F419042